MAKQSSHPWMVDIDLYFWRYIMSGAFESDKSLFNSGSPTFLFSSTLDLHWWPMTNSPSTHAHSYQGFLPDFFLHLEHYHSITQQPTVTSNIYEWRHRDFWLTPSPLPFILRSLYQTWCGSNVGLKEYAIVLELCGIMEIGNVGIQIMNSACWHRNKWYDMPGLHDYVDVSLWLCPSANDH